MEPKDVRIRAGLRRPVRRRRPAGQIPRPVGRAGPFPQVQPRARQVRIIPAVAVQIVDRPDAVRYPVVNRAILLHEEDGGGGVALGMKFLEHLYGGNPRVAKMIHPDIHFVFPLILSGDAVSEQYAKEWRALVQENPGFSEGDLYDALGFEGKNTVISVKEANFLLGVLSRYSLEGGYTTVVIYLPEKMNSVAANKLLKILEEPPQQTLFLMVTHAPERLLPTILSRCQLFRLESSGSAEVTLRYDDGGLLASLMDAVIARDLSAALEVGEPAFSWCSRGCLL